MIYGGICNCDPSQNNLDPPVDSPVLDFDKYLIIIYDILPGFNIRNTTGVTSGAGAVSTSSYSYGSFNQALVFSIVSCVLLISSFSIPLTMPICLSIFGSENSFFVCFYSLMYIFLSLS